MRVNDVQKNGCINVRSLNVLVMNENKKHLDRQAVVKLHDPRRDTSLYQATTGESDPISPGGAVTSWVRAGCPRGAFSANLKFALLLVS
jgi:hypothetical protein